MTTKTSDEKIDDIHTGMTEMRTQFAVFMARFDAHVESDKRVELLVVGSGEAPGLKGRVDRLEVSEVRRDRGFWILFTAAVASLVTALGAFFRPTPPH